MKREGAWLGPCEHSWPLSTLKRVGRFSAGAGFPDAEQGVQDEELPFYKVSDMNADGNAVYMIESANTVNRATAERLGATVFAADTIVFPKVGAALLSNKRRILTRPSCVDNNTMGLTITHGWPKYFHYLLTCMDFGLLANPGAVPSLNESQVREIRACLPGESEQRAIAKFLDRETQTIDALVAKKQRLVGLLQEKRTALISHAVTKGLDPDVPMKDSGIEWLGQVPARWQVMSLSRVTKSRCDGPFGSGLKSDHYVDAGRRVIRLQNIASGRFDNRDCAFVNEDYYRHHLGEHDVLPGDVLIAGLGDDTHPVGRACVAPEGLGDAMVKADCFRFRLDLRKADPHFLALHLSATAPAISALLSSGATRTRVNMSTMATRRIAIPPHWEQRAIVSCVERAETRMNDLMQSVAEAIERLREYRSALITAAVTGQIDVGARKARRQAEGP